MKRRRLRRRCDRCDRVRIHNGGGLCDSCYRLVRYPYEPTGVGRGGPGVEKSADVLFRRIDEFAQYRRSGRTIAEAAGMAGVSDRTGQRYEKRLKAERAERAEAVRGAA